MPALAMPPPLPSTRPPVTVTSAISVVTPEATSNTRSIPEPSISVCLAPAPWIVTLFVRSRSPVAAASSAAPAIVSRNRPAGMAIVSPPRPAFAALTASRSEQSESQAPGAGSSRRVTVKVAAWAFAAAAKATDAASATPVRILIGAARR